MKNHDQLLMLIKQLTEQEKLELVNLLLEQLNTRQKENLKTSGLCGVWQDERSAEEILREIVENRTDNREVNL